MITECGIQKNIYDPYLIPYMCAAISNDGVLCHIPATGPHSTERLITFLNALNERLVPHEERGLLRPGMTLRVIIWDDVAFHRSRRVNGLYDDDANSLCILSFYEPN